MTLQAIKYGAAANDGTGDSLREAMRKTQQNFEYLDQGKVDKVAGMGLSSNNFTNAERVKLANIAEAATKNRSDAELLNRDNHTGGFNGYGASNDMRNGTALPASSPPNVFFGMGSIVGLARGDELGTPVASYGIFRCDAQWIDASAGYGVSRSFSSGGRKFESYALPENTWSAWDETAANNFTDVPTTQKAPVIFVTQPHFRTFVWNGTKYVRAPWDRPGVLFFSHAPAANVTHGIQVRADVTYNKADYPDLAEILGVAGTTFVLPEGRARVLRAADNGRGIDSALVNGYLQEDAIRNFTGDLTGFSSGFFSDTLLTGGVFGAAVTAAETVLRGGPGLAGSGRMTATIDASKQVPTASENRVKSLVATLYITK